MKISLVRTGGFANIRLTGEVDVDSLPPEEAQKLKEMVEAADFFNLPATSFPARPGVDRFQYEITVEQDAKRHVVRVSEETIPPKLEPLIRYLIEFIRNRRQ